MKPISLVARRLHCQCICKCTCPNLLTSLWENGNKWFLRVSCKLRTYAWIASYKRNLPHIKWPSYCTRQVPIILFLTFFNPWINPFLYLSDSRSLFNCSKESCQKKGNQWRWIQSSYQQWQAWLSISIPPSFPRHRRAATTLATMLTIFLNYWIVS